MPAESIGGFVTHAIQLAIAPVFLLSGFGALLGVMTTRLGRVIDRARFVEKSWPDLDENGRGRARVEIHTLETRRRICSWSIGFCSTATLLVCVVIVTLFAEEFLGLNLRGVIGTLFVLAMLSIICALTCFLREIYLATHSTSIELARYK